MAITHEQIPQHSDFIQLDTSRITCPADEKFAELHDPLAYYDSLDSLTARRGVRGLAVTGRTNARRELSGLTGESASHDETMSLPPTVFRALKVRVMADILARSENLNEKERGLLEIDLRTTDFDELRALYESLVIQVGGKLSFYRWFIDSTEPSKIAERRFPAAVSSDEEWTPSSTLDGRGPSDAWLPYKD